MKKLLLIVLALVGGFIIYNTFLKPESVQQNIVRQANTPVPSIAQQTKEQQYVFIPYWTFTKNITADSEYSLIYFGISVNTQGVDTDETGYQKLQSFVRFTPHAREKILAVRMIDKNVNAQILKNKAVQEEIASETVALAQQHGFDGVLLDYETSAFAFDSTVNNISSFYQLFSDKVKAQNLLFYVTLYGDTYFQSRPFDVVKIGQLSDKVLIMAYDFSKSRGNPGPNFPLTDTNEYGYSFEKMIDEYQRDVDNQKLVVTMGYFGYDWKVNEKGESVTNGVPLSTNEINQDFVEGCEFVSCKLTRNRNSEPSIKYTDKNGADHIVWFEDEVSVKKKTDFLKSKGILEVAAWAYSYN